MNKERTIVTLLREIASENGFEYRTYSYDWVKAFTKNGTSMYVYGYNFPINQTSFTQIANDKACTSEILSASGIPNVEHSYFMCPNNIHYVKYLGIEGNWKQMIALLEKYGKIICKPNSGTGGVGLRIVVDLGDVVVVGILHTPLQSRFTEGCLGDDALGVDLQGDEGSQLQIDKVSHFLTLGLALDQLALLGQQIVDIVPLFVCGTSGGIGCGREQRTPRLRPCDAVYSKVVLALVVFYRCPCLGAVDTVYRKVVAFVFQGSLKLFDLIAPRPIADLTSCHVYLLGYFFFVSSTDFLSSALWFSKVVNAQLSWSVS
jgi:hypothetical protein